MWTAYSTKDAAEIVGLSESVVRSCVRDGLLTAQADVLPLRYSFQDLSILKTLRLLVTKGVSLRRAKRQLGSLATRHISASGLGLASLSIDAHNGQVVVRAPNQVWRADNGQLVFDFQFEPQKGEISELPHLAPAPGPQFIDNKTADEWFEFALGSEEENSQQAIEAYLQVLRQRPDCTESMVNMGRLHAERNQLELATKCFKNALEINAGEATALYNLGVIAQDTGYDLEAIQYYEASLSFDAALAEAHYNLATIFDRSGDARSAIRHINEFRKLSKRR